jgi:hypothetical protein
MTTNNPSLVFTMQGDGGSLVANFGPYLPLPISATLQDAINAMATVDSAVSQATTPQQPVQAMQQQVRQQLQHLLVHPRDQLPTLQTAHQQQQLAQQAQQHRQRMRPIALIRQPPVRAQQAHLQQMQPTVLQRQRLAQARSLAR